MSDNGKLKQEKILLKVSLVDGKMAVTFGAFNAALISHAFIEALSKWQEELALRKLEKEMESQPAIVIPDNVMKNIRRR